MVDGNVVAADAGQNSEHSDQYEVQSEFTAQFEAAKDEIEKLKKMLDEARLQIVELQESVRKKRFSIKVMRDSDRDVNFYTGLPSAAVFDTLFEYLSPDGRRSNVVYRPTAQRWVSDCPEGKQPGEAEWRDTVLQVGRPGR